MKRDLSLKIAIISVCFCLIAAILCPAVWSGQGDGSVINVPPDIQNPGDSFSFVFFGDTRPSSSNMTEKDIADDTWGARRNALIEAAVSEIEGKNALFTVFTGDIPNQGYTKQDWEYFWKLVPGDMRGVNSSGPRFFPAVGNHELWDDCTGAGYGYYLETFPFLKQEGQGINQFRHNYAFYSGDNLFISLCSGGYGVKKIINGCKNYDLDWTCKQCGFLCMKEWMIDLINDGVTNKKIKNLFVLYHKPSMTRSKHCPLSWGTDPYTYILPITQEHPSLNVYVLNGHNHTTEVFKKDNVTFMVGGGGGAPQDDAVSFSQNIRKLDLSSGNKYSDYKLPDDILWNGQTAIPMRVNYFVFNVNGNKIEIQEKCLRTDFKSVKEKIQAGFKIGTDGKVTWPKSDNCNFQKTGN